VNYNGQRARTPEQLEALQKYSSVFLDYCHYGDPMCAVGSEPANVTAHLDYFLEHNEEVSKWIAGKAQGKAVSVPSQSSASKSMSPAKATAEVETPTSIAVSATGSLAAEASQTSNAGNSGSTGVGSVLSAGDYLVSIMVVLSTTLFSVALL